MQAVIDFLIIILTFIVLLTPLVAIHEFGHLIMSRLVGVKILEYGIGIPPRAKGWFKKGILWTINWIPLGGFVRTYGDHDALDEASHIYAKDSKEATKTYKEARLQELVYTGDLERFLGANGLEYDSEWKDFAQKSKGKETKQSEKVYKSKLDQLNTLMEWELEANITSKEAFFNKNWIQQSLILTGGVLFNFLTAIVCFWIVFSFTGTIEAVEFAEDYKYIDDVKVAEESTDVYVNGVFEDSPADEAGLETGAKIFSLAGVSMSNIQSRDDFNDIIDNNKDQEVEIVFQNKDKSLMEKRITLDKTKIGDKEDYVLGVAQIGRKTSYKGENIFSSFYISAVQVYDFVDLNFRFIGRLFAGDSEAVKLVSGPVGIGNIGGVVIERTGFTGFLYLLALISIGLGVFNLLPIPALDGGRWLIITINKITKRRNKKVEGALIYFSFMLLLLLSLLIFLKDINDWINGVWG